MHVPANLSTHNHPLRLRFAVFHIILVYVIVAFPYNLGSLGLAHKDGTFEQRILHRILQNLQVIRATESVHSG